MSRKSTFWNLVELGCCPRNILIKDPLSDLAVEAACSTIYDVMKHLAKLKMSGDLWDKDTGCFLAHFRISQQ